MKRIILFDLDGTLFYAGRSGRKAFTAAIRFLRPELSLDTFSFAGKTDMGILNRLVGERLAPGLHREMLSIYPPLLQAYLYSEPGVAPLPGAISLLWKIYHSPHYLPIVQTGNMEVGARIKLEFFSMNGPLPHMAAGDRATDRSGLLLEAKAKAESILGYATSPADFLVVGDTGEEMEAARSLGMESLAVETGYPGKGVRAGNPDHCLENLTDHDAFFQILRKNRDTNIRN